MDAITPSQHERTEVELVLQSGIFDKAPRLGKFFRYICERHFEGEGDQIKEYSIALEALGRSSEFDPKKDSIVRVEAHRLRKRLDEFYRGPGAERPFRVTIPNGQYRPHFVANEPKSQATEPANPGQRMESILHLPELAADHVAQPTVADGRPLGRKRWFWVVALTCGLTVTAVLFAHRRTPMASPVHQTAAVSDVWTGSANDVVPAEFRMLVGYHGAAYVDNQGHTWVPDAYYKGGKPIPIGPDHFIQGQPDPHLIRSQRTGEFEYSIPLAQGPHELHLYFAETEYGQGNPGGGGESTRVFTLTINGGRPIQMDPLTGAGGANRLHDWVMKDVVPAPDGKLHLAFSPITRPAILNAIEILSSTLGHVRPVRIVAQTTPVTDSDGRLWAGDMYFLGGTVAVRRNMVSNEKEKALYQGERYGNFAYRIPLAPGKYKLTLHFAETWFGTPESGAPAEGMRVFDVFANGATLLRNFDVAKEAGGPYRKICKTFDNVKPNAQGVLNLEFVPVKNYAEVNAIEVVDAN